jgi:fucose permease
MTILLFASRPLWKQDATQEAEGTSPVTTREALHLKGIGWALLGLFAMQGLEFCSGIWSGSYLHLVGGCSAELAAKWSALFYCGMTCGRFLAGFVVDRLGNHKMLRIGAGVVAGGVMLLLTATNVLQMQIGLGCLGLGVAPLFPCFLHSTPTHFGACNTQAVMGLQMACAYMGATLMPPALGWVAQRAEMMVYPYFLGGFLIVMVLSLEQLKRARSQE